MEEIKEYADKWWLVVFQGVLGIIFGLIMIAVPGKTLAFITLMFGIFILLEGVILIIITLFHTKSIHKWGLVLLQGIVAILLGLAIFAWPTMTIAILFFFVAIWILIAGAVMIFQGIKMRKELDAAEWFMIAGGVIFVLIGAFLLSNPTVSIQIAGILLGLSVMLSGIFTTAFGFQLRSTRSKVRKQLQ